VGDQVFASVLQHFEVATLVLCSASPNTDRFADGQRQDIHEAFVEDWAWFAARVFPGPVFPVADVSSSFAVVAFLREKNGVP
jgi:hypothetical protein